MTEYISREQLWIENETPLKVIAAMMNRRCYLCNGDIFPLRKETLINYLDIDEGKEGYYCPNCKGIWLWRYNSVKMVRLRGGLFELVYPEVLDVGIKPLEIKDEKDVDRLFFNILNANCIYGKDHGIANAIYNPYAKIRHKCECIEIRLLFVELLNPIVYMIRDNLSIIFRYKDRDRGLQLMENAHIICRGDVNGTTEGVGGKET